ncbi:MAG: hypothetical protein EOR71_10600 [Mesorhizobium sp.]|nr:MAG: hypothetical protein EOR71_10600 [Mesorhizobium sp.]
MPIDRKLEAKLDRIGEWLAIALLILIVVGGTWGVVWLYQNGWFASGFKILIALLIGSGLASIRFGVLGIGLLLMALAGLMFGPFGLLAGLLLTIVLLLARR